MAKSKRHQESWERLFDQKRREFLENDCRMALEVSNFDELQVGLQDVVSAHRSTGFPDLLSRLKPSLEHVKSFENAVTSASQYDSRTCLIWGSTQALIKVSKKWIAIAV